jgi:hypothetical protein
MSNRSRSRTRSGRIHGTRTYEWANQMLAGYQPSKRQSVLEPIPEETPQRRTRTKTKTKTRTKSKSKSIDSLDTTRSKTKSASKKATLSQQSFTDIQGGLWRKKQESRIVLPSLRTRDLIIEMSGDDQVIETVLIPTLEDAVKRAKKMGSTIMTRCKLYLARLLEMCINIAYAASLGDISFDQDAAGQQMFLYKLWLLGNTCMDLLQSLGVNVQKQYGDQHELFQEVYPVYFENEPPTPKNVALAPKKKWWK